jgi:hypothetical protein
LHLLQAARSTLPPLVHLLRVVSRRQQACDGSGRWGLLWLTAPSCCVRVVVVVVVQLLLLVA